MNASAKLVLWISAAAMLGSCSTTPVEQVRSPRAQKELADHITSHPRPPDQRATAFTRCGPGASRFSGPHETHSLVG